MIKKEIYPKTKRINNEFTVYVTEKLDGSDIGIFKINNELIIAQRGIIFNLNELDSIKEVLYKGLYQWLKNNGKNLLESLNEGNGFFVVNMMNQSINQ